MYKIDLFLKGFLSEVLTHGFIDIPVCLFDIFQSTAFVQQIREILPVFSVDFLDEFFAALGLIGCRLGSINQYSQVPALFLTLFQKGFNGFFCIIGPGGKLVDSHTRTNNQRGY